MLKRALSCLLLTFALFHEALVEATYDFSTGTCKTLSGSRLTNPCVGVVDYSYYLPSGTTEASLASTASIKLNATVISSAPSACQSNLVRYVCASIYLKCKTGVVLSDTTTYNYDIYSPLSVTYGVPYLRPCGTVCTQLLSTCTLTGKLLTLPTVAQCTSGTYDYSLGSGVSGTNPTKYQTDNNSSRCFSPATVTLSGAKETYDTTLSNAVCTGFVDKFYVPPANKINSAYTSLQLPKVVQGILNTAVSTSFNQLKSVMDDQCMIAMLKRLCYSAFIPAEDVTLRTALERGGTALALISAATSAGFPMTATVTIPAYPNYNYCLDYKSKCARLISAVSAANVNCNATVTGSDGTVYRTFPSTDQTISTASKTLGANTLYLKFVSNATADAYYNSSAYFSYHTSALSKYDFSTGTCKTLTASRLTNPCVGVVDYSYYVPSSTSDAALAREANIKLNSSVISSMPMDCQTRLVRYVCATIYLKCKSGVTLSDETTYNYDMYSPMGVTYGVPYLRPCGSVCTELPTYCTATGKLATLPTVAQCKAERYDYSKGSGVSPAFPARYQIDEDTSKCYAPNLITLSGAKETYDTTAANAVCTGFVDQFFVPPGNKINPSFAALQPPKVAQTAINTEIANRLKMLKPWVGEECMLALKKRICYSSFLTPEDVTLRTALEQGGMSTAVISAISASGAVPMTATVTIPSYPHYHYCVDYNKKCSLLIEQAAAQGTDLRADCNATTTGTDGTVYRIFPSEDQIISTATRTVGAVTLHMTFKSNATTNAYYNSDQDTYAVKCPRGFSVPADPDAKEVQIIGASDCAANCL